MRVDRRRSSIRSCAILRRGTNLLRFLRDHARERPVQDCRQHRRFRRQSSVGEPIPGLGGRPIHFRLTNRPSCDSRIPAFSARCTARAVSSTRPAFSAPLDNQCSRPQGFRQSIGRGLHMRKTPPSANSRSKAECASVDRADPGGQDSAPFSHMSERSTSSSRVPPGRAIRLGGNVYHRRLRGFEVRPPIDR